MEAVQQFASREGAGLSEFWTDVESQAQLIASGMAASAKRFGLELRVGGDFEFGVPSRPLRPTLARNFRLRRSMEPRNGAGRPAYPRDLPGLSTGNFRQPPSAIPGTFGHLQLTPCQFAILQQSNPSQFIY